MKIIEKSTQIEVISIMRGFDYTKIDKMMAVNSTNDIPKITPKYMVKSV